jgi:hypothetical protein
MKYSISSMFLYRTSPSTSPVTKCPPRCIMYPGRSCKGDPRLATDVASLRHTVGHCALKPLLVFSVF